MICPNDNVHQWWNVTENVFQRQQVCSASDVSKAFLGPLGY